MYLISTVNSGAEIKENETVGEVTGTQNTSDGRTSEDSRFFRRTCNAIGTREYHGRGWESHDPTQGMRQGNDVGTQYRSAVYCYCAEQLRLAEASRERYQKVLSEAGSGPITSEIREAPPFYYAEDYHQQYLAKNPQGYCGLDGTGVAFPVD